MLTLAATACRACLFRPPLRLSGHSSGSSLREEDADAGVESLDQTVRHMPERLLVPHRAHRYEVALQRLPRPVLHDCLPAALSASRTHSESVTAREGSAR